MDTRQPESMVELAAIEELHRRDREAAMAGEVSALLDLVTDDVVLLPPGGAPVVGKEAVAEMLAREDGTRSGTEILEYVQDFQEVSLYGDVAVEWGRYRGRSRLEDGEEAASSGSLLRILRRGPDGAWKVARSIWTEDRP